jgi:hypothetical protein
MKLVTHFLNRLAKTKSALKSHVDKFVVKKPANEAMSFDERPALQ